MSGKAVPLLLHHVRALAVGPDLPDEKFLADYLARRDEAAFAAIVARHGPMVLNLCRRRLHDPAAAEDVFQATFLALAERAAAIRRRESLAAWLYGVAYRLAVRAKRRASLALPAGDMAGCDSPAAGPAERLAWQEMLAILDEELERLSDRHRAPLVLCYLEGRTQDEASRLLGWSLGTLRRRLEQGRRLLEVRLRGRGVTLPAALAGLLAAGTASVPAPLQAAAVAACGLGVAAARRGMTAASVRKLVALAVCGCALGLGVWLHGAAFRKAAPPAVAPATAPVGVFRAAVEAVDACGPNFLLLLGLGVQEARRGDAAAARKRFQQAADLLADKEGKQRAIGLALVAYRLADAGDRDAAAALLGEARAMAPTIPEGNERNDLLRFCTACLAEKIDTALALAWAKDITDDSWRHSAWRDIAIAQAEAGDLAGAGRTIELMRAPFRYSKPLQALAAAQLKAGKRDAALATLRLALAELEQKRKEKREDTLGEEVEVLVGFAVAQARAGDRAGARQTFARAEKALAPGSRPEPLTLLATLGRGQAEAGQREAAVRTVRRFLRAVEQHEDDAASLEGLLPAQLALGEYDWVVKVLRRTRNLETLYKTCEGLAAAGQDDVAVAVAREQKSAEARAWGLVGAARGAQQRIPPERLPRYAGKLLVTVRTRPAAKLAPEKATPDPARQMRAAVEKWEQAWEKFNERLTAAKTEEERRAVREKGRPSADECAGELLALARKYAGQPVAVEALSWIVEFAGDTSAGEQALTLCRQEHLATRKAGEVCSLATYSTHAGATEKLLRAVLEKSPHRAARGQACLALAHFLRAQATRARLVQKGRAKDVKAFEGAFGAEQVRRLRAADPAKLQAEAERLYERVLDEFADVFPPRNTEAIGKGARRALDEIRLLAVGKTAPDIQGEDVDGKPLRLSEYRGKVVVLVFWATWCAPCRAMIPHEKALVKRLAGKPFVLLGVNGDGDRAKLRDWLGKNPLPWRSWWDGKEDGQGPIARAWNVSAWPTVYVLDPRGVIRHRDVFDKELDEAVDGLLKAGATGKAAAPRPD